MRPNLTRLRNGVTGGSRRLRRFLFDGVPDRLVPDRFVLARRFEQAFGRPLDLKHPRTFNEKLCWLMLYYRTPLVTRLADKYEVRSYVAERVGSRVLNTLYGVWDRVADVDFEHLPDAFVLKVTWGSGMNILCPRKSELNVDATKEQLTSWMRRNYHWFNREWCYRDIKPRIVCERLLTDPKGAVPSDYKFFCFGGEPRFVVVVADRFTEYRRSILDLDWQPLPFAYAAPSSGHLVPRPSTLPAMTACARALAAGFPFLRVDLYSVDARPLFGEATWYPYAAAARFVPDSYDRDWGDVLPLPARPVYR